MENFYISNNTYEIVEIDNSTIGVSKILKHISEMKKSICKKKQSLHRWRFKMGQKRLKKIIIYIISNE